VLKAQTEYIGGTSRFAGALAVFKDNKFLIYCGAPLTFAAVALSLPILSSDPVFCVDNRVICAPLALPMDDEPSGNEPQPILGTRSPLIAVASTVVNLSATTMLKVSGGAGIKTSG
jgi:hypothetical protein